MNKSTATKRISSQEYQVNVNVHEQCNIFLYSNRIKRVYTEPDILDGLFVYVYVQTLIVLQ